MITHNEAEPEYIAAPVNLDRAIQEIQRALKTNLTWLSRAYGRARALPEILNGKAVTYPKVYYGGLLDHEYKNVLLNDTVDASSWFQLTGPETPLDYTHANLIQKYQAPLSVIFWFNLEKVKMGLTTENYIHTELIKRDIHRILNRYPNITIVRIYDENAKVIFKEYTTDEPMDQFLMHPKKAIRFDIQLTYDYDCAVA
jgi:hypothetical protein